MNELPFGACSQDRLSDYEAYFGKRKISSSEKVELAKNLLCLNDETAYVQGDWTNANFASIWIKIEHCGEQEDSSIDCITNADAIE